MQDTATGTATCAVPKFSGGILSRQRASMHMLMKLSCAAFFALGLSAAVPYAEEVAQIKQGIKQMSSKKDTLHTMK